MALIKTKESSPATLLPNTSSRLPTDTVVTVPEELDGRVITEEQLVVDTFTNNTAINVDNYHSAVSDITGLISGSVVKVTYYTRNTPTTDIQTRTVDMTTAFKDNVHIALTQIRNFELRVQGSFEFQWKEEVNNAGVTVEAIIMPGFNPQVEDTFLYEMRNGKIGIFKVSSVARLALGQDTYHKIQATLQDWLTPAFSEKLRSQTTAIRYFDKSKFLTGNHAFLDSDYYRLKQQLTILRTQIVNSFYNNYYDTTISSFLRPDDIYDPYVVEFWNKKVSCMDTPSRPSQLLVAVNNYKKTIWAMMSGGPLQHLEQLENRVTFRTRVNTNWDACITALLNKNYLVVGDDEIGDDPTGLVPKRKIEQLTSLVPEAPLPIPINRREDLLRTSKAYEELRLRVAAEVYMAGHQHEAHTLKYAPPYPILSNNQLLSIWRKLEGKSNDDILSNEDAERASGFLHWYRTTYPGTLTKYELEQRYRIKHDIKGTLSPVDILGLEEYIRDYRSRHAKIKTDLEVTVTWRVEHRLSLDEELTPEQEEDLRKTIADYRRNHGYCVDDHLFVGTDAGIDVDTITEVPPIFTDREYVTDIPLPPLPDTNTPQPTPIGDYVVSSSFYQSSSNLDPFEDLLFKVLMCKDINPKDIYETTYECLSQPVKDVTTFYRTLISIYLIDRTLRWIHEEA